MKDWKQEEAKRQQAAVDEAMAFASAPTNDPKTRRYKLLERPGTTYIRRGPKVERNQPCPCGSGEKAKRCCYK